MLLYVKRVFLMVYIQNKFNHEFEISFHDLSNWKKTAWYAQEAFWLACSTFTVLKVSDYPWARYQEIRDYTGESYPYFPIKIAHEGEWTKEKLLAFREEDLSSLTLEKRKELNTHLFQHKIAPQNRIYQAEELPNLPDSHAFFTQEELEWIQLILKQTEATASDAVKKQLYLHNFPPVGNALLPLELPKTIASLKTNQFYWFENFFLANPIAWKKLRIEQQQELAPHFLKPLKTHPISEKEVFQLSHPELQGYYQAFKESPKTLRAFPQEMRCTFATRMKHELNLDVEKVFDATDLTSSSMSKKLIALALILMLVVIPTIGFFAMQKKPETAPLLLSADPETTCDEEGSDATCLLTSYTTDNPERLEMSQLVVANHKKYAEKHGYRYLEYPENLAKGDEPYWSKIAAVNRILNGEEETLKCPPKWVVWLDDDAVIGDQMVQIDDVIAHYEAENPDVKVIITEDAMSHIFPHIPLNTGVMLIKNDDWSRTFFQKVWEKRNTRAFGQSYTYASCPNQSCLHEQQVISDLRETEGLENEIQVIPQRDRWAMNTFCRLNHYDIKRDMDLDYDADLPSSRCQKGDFISQCTGLATQGHVQGRPYGENLRLRCIEQLV